MRGLLPLADKVRATLEAGEGLELELAEVEKLGAAGARESLGEFGREVRQSVAEVGELFGPMLELAAD
ncbi:MAG: hypothetical protein AAFP84_11155 [Actinomycetota bacterium]